MKSSLAGTLIALTVVLSTPASALTVFVDSDNDGLHNPLIEMRQGETLSVDVWASLSASEDSKGGLLAFGNEGIFDQAGIVKVTAASIPASTWSFIPSGEPGFNDNSVHALAGNLTGYKGAVMLYSFDLQGLDFGNILLSFTDYPLTPQSFDSNVLADGTVLDGNVNYLSSIVRVVPVPNALILLGSGFLGLIGWRR